MKFRNDNSEYERSHGKRAAGRGLWMFRVEMYFGHGDASVYEFSASGTLGDARNAVRRRVKAEHADALEVRLVTLA